MTGKLGALIILDGVGIGPLPDARAYGDEDSNTLAHLARETGGLDIPALERLGLGAIAPITGVARPAAPSASFGKMAEKAPGKDSTSGHWELAGLILEQPFPTYPDGFPEEILAPFRQAAGTDILGNYAASGTEIIKELGAEHVKTGKPIVYTSADSVFQVAAHEEVIPLEELYRICREARVILEPPHRVGRVIARPFMGEPGSFNRTPNRRDYSVPPQRETLLDYLGGSGVEVISIGKVYDLFAGAGIDRRLVSKSNGEGVEKLKQVLGEPRNGDRFVIITLVDFDMLWGHRNDTAGFKNGLEEFDRLLPGILALLEKQDLLIMSADHGNDPVTPSTDHSREYVPVLAYRSDAGPGRNLGVRETFADVAATFADHFDLSPFGPGRSFFKM